MQTLLARDVAFSFGGTSVPLFSNINFSLSTPLSNGQSNLIQAIVGRNGVGKSLFLRILAGYISPTSGEVVTNIATEQIGYLSQYAELGTKTVADVIGLTTLRHAYQVVCSGSASDEEFTLLDGRWDFEDKALRVLTQVRLSLDSLNVKCTSLSGGQQTKVRLASLLMRDCTLLLLDEPSNHLDCDMRTWLLAFLQNFSGHSVIVTHDTRLLEIAHTVSELTPTAMHTSTGGWLDYQRSRAIQLESLNKQVVQHKSELRQAKRQQQADRERHERAQNQAKKERATSNSPKILLDFRAGRSDKTTARLTTLHEQRTGARKVLLSDAQAELEHILPLSMTPSEPKKISSPVLQVFDVVLPHGIQSPVNVMLQAGDRLAILGANGSGKSSLLRVLMSNVSPQSGEIHITKSVMMLDQHLSLLDMNDSALVNFQRLSPSAWQESDYRTVLAQLRLRGGKALLPIASLSGGERLKVALACVFLGESAPALLLLDEPDNHLDFESKSLLANTIAQYHGAVVMVSHDTDFISTCCIERKVYLSLS